MKGGFEYCGDFVWMKDVVLRFLESFVYFVFLLDFIDENCGMFEDLDDNKLEYIIVSCGLILDFYVEYVNDCFLCVKSFRLGFYV